MVDPKIQLSSAQAAQFARLQAQKAAMNMRVLIQIEAKEDFQDWAQKGDFQGMDRRFRTLDEQKKNHARIKKIGGKDELSDDDTFIIEEAKAIEDAASRFESRNPELKMKTLLILRSSLKPDDTADEILKKVLDVYSDYSLADEALEFLIETTSGALKENVLKARSQFLKNYEREIKAGRNIAAHAREFSEQGLGSPTGLRDMYRDVTGNPRDAHALFQELFSEYSYAKMKTVIDFLLHSLGADLKSKGPSISRPELTRLIDDARTLASILGVYRFFKERTKLIDSQCRSYRVSVPPRLNFELLAKQFMQLIAQRYISPDKVLHMARVLGISEELAAQIIIFTQMRDAIRQVAPKLFRNNRHKQDALKAILDTLEDLEEEYEEEEEE